MPARRVLVVEDEDNIASALEYLMVREGYAHDRIASGLRALDHIRETRPDLVLLDVMLPGVSGYEICEGMRRDPALAGIKILMMTARGSASDRVKALTLGADGFVTKPFDLAVLRSELHRLVAVSAR